MDDESGWQAARLGQRSEFSPNWRAGRIFSLSTGSVVTLRVMSGVASSAGGNGVMLSERANASAPASGRGFRVASAEVLLAFAAFAAMCFFVLSVAPQSAEPDDGAYRASIVAMTEGHFLTLSAPQAEVLAARLGDNPAAPPNQWVALADGRYISEKDPGYPFLAVAFEALGLIRLAPLFYGALACVGLFIGARRWLGSFGGAAAVGLYCSSGAALAFAWRDYMPTFTDASLTAAGSGTLLWALLAIEATSRQRRWVGLAGFLAFELATFVRYTNIVILGCAIATVVAASRARAVRLPLSTLFAWLASAVASCAGIAVFNSLVYGGPLKSGYSAGEVTFRLGAIPSNLRLVPAHLIQAMPMLVLGSTAFAWIVVQRFIARRAGGPPRAGARRDLYIGGALAASWLAIWAVYSAYTWTTDPTNVAVQDVRFYLPATGAISLLGAWLVTRLPARAWRVGVTSAAVAAMFGLGVWSFHAMYAALGITLRA
jgi:hypothetical protein